MTILEFFQKEQFLGKIRRNKPYEITSHRSLLYVLFGSG
jgi:hypothetical protein